ncbi:MAG: TIGR04283 family arsenosugar biosynthesis glycosyltransferase, partial [Bythopirellula sp.]
IERAVKSVNAAGIDEVIVADGGSDDRTPQLATQSGASVVHGERGRAVQLNLGAQHATGDILLFLHADNWLDETAGEQMCACLGDGSILAGAFEQHIEADGVLYRLLERGNSLRARWRGLAYGDQAIFIRRDIFDQLGGFPQVKLMEDLLLMRALRKIGSKLQLLPGPVHVHPRRWQQRGVVRQTLCNWSLLCSERLGVAPDRLAKFYPSHDHLN